MNKVDSKSEGQGFNYAIQCVTLVVCVVENNEQQPPLQNLGQKL